MRLRNWASRSAARRGGAGSSPEIPAKSTTLGRRGGQCGNDVVETDSHRRHAKLVGRRLRPHVPSCVPDLAEQTGRSLKGRQPGWLRRGEAAQPLRQRLQGITAVGRELHKVERVCSHQRIASQGRIGQRGVEKQAVRQARHPRGKRVLRLAGRRQFLRSTAKNRFDPTTEVPPPSNRTAVAAAVENGAIVALFAVFKARRPTGLGATAYTSKGGKLVPEWGADGEVDLLDGPIDGDRGGAVSLQSVAARRLARAEGPRAAPPPPHTTTRATRCRASSAGHSARPPAAGLAGIRLGIDRIEAMPAAGRAGWPSSPQRRSSRARLSVTSGPTGREAVRRARPSWNCRPAGRPS